MIGVRTSFFDRKLVMRKTRAGERQALSKFGAYTRTRAKSSLKYRKRTSAAPGQPPFVHKTRSGKSPLKDLIYFSYEEKNGQPNVVIGPTPFKGPVGIVPPILEEGGNVPARLNPRRRKRVLGSSGELRIGGPKGQTTHRNTEGKWVTYGKLKTAGQVERANRLNAELYGPERFAGKDRAARPFMKPAFHDTLTKLPTMLAGSIK